MQSESKNVAFKIKLYDIKMIYATDMGGGGLWGFFVQILFFRAI
jgi:uncharacterized membrane protein